ncbi:synaptic vesicle glycoprotein 2A-like [Melitaea cinxia]|uniref:synaptic vesicle glycoprotein 2A-like n=1 Tax=Melitaea cinxia TaxID=113334 RepID=UPI001E273423|nr:synaptic vesicle glycoprotein 2A-like [Melitaea cinxia]
MDKEKETPTPFEDALERTGNGLYNVLLVLTCGLILLAIGVDLFGFGLVVSVACDLNITVAQKGILTSLPYVGILLVSYIWGYISDTCGRKFSLIVSVQAAFVLSCLASFSTNWWILGLMKFLSVCFSCAANSATYTLVGESCIKRVRSKYMLLMTCLLILSPGIGAVMSYPTLLLDFETEIPFLGINFTPWRLLIIVLALPLGIGGAAICFFHESPKFLINCDRNDEAIEVLQHMHSINNRDSKDNFQVTSIYLEDAVATKQTSLCRAMYELGAPLFRPPMLWRTLQLFFIVAVVYFTNNSLLVWLPYIMNTVMLSMEQNTTTVGDICSVISINPTSEINGTLSANATAITPEVCLGYIEDNVIITLFMAQSIYAFLTFIISYLMKWRRIVLLTILTISSLSGVLLNLMPEPISSVFLLMVFTCTNLGMGILASYFVDLYPTSCRGMVACLSIMVGRTSTFIGINVVGNLIFYHCHVTFYMWALLVLSSVLAAWFLPPDKPLKS